MCENAPSEQVPSGAPCEVEFFWEVFFVTKVRRHFYCGAVTPTYPYYQIGVLESILYYLVQIVNVRSEYYLYVGIRRKNPPV